MSGCVRRAGHVPDFSSGWREVPYSAMTVGGDEQFGDLLRRLRIAASLTQEQLAEKAGLSYRGISDLERGARGRPRLDTIRRLTEALQLTGATLMAFTRSGTGTALPSVAAESTPPASNIPVMPNPFTGRTAILADLEELLVAGDHRLITHRGPGGAGKSRLAMELGRRIGAGRGIAAIWVGLAPLTEPSQVMEAIRLALGAGELESSKTDAVIRTIGSRVIVLILDNFEHVADARIEIAHLLTECPRLTVVATSRTPLGVYGEHVFPVGPLSLSPEPSDSGESEAAKLFRSRLPADAGRSDDGADLGRVIDAICRRLNGLPLALELAAARTWTMSPAELLHDLQTNSSLDVVEQAPAGGPSMHESLSAAIAWSLRFLSGTEIEALLAASVFRGGFGGDALIAVSGQPTATRAMAALVRGSLVDVHDRRFSLLEPIREFAEEQAAIAGMAESLTRAHIRFFVDFTELAALKLFGSEQSAWLASLETEHDNFRAALHNAIERGEWEAAGRIAQACARFWRVRGHLSEGRDWMRRILRAADDLEPALAARLAYSAGSLASAQSDLAEAERLQLQGLELARTLGDADTAAKCLNGLGIIARSRGDEHDGDELVSQSLDLRRQIGDNWGAAACLVNLGNSAVGRKDFDRAESLFDESLQLWRDCGDAWGVAFSLASLAELSLNRLDYVRAANLAAESLELRRDLNDRLDVYITAGLLGEALARQGADEEARTLVFESIEGTFGLNSAESTIRTLANAATVLGLRRHPSGPTLWAAIGPLREQVGVQTDTAEVDRISMAIADTQPLIPTDVWADAWARGLDLTLGEAVGLALESLRDTTGPR